ncbi:MAG: SRPBCC domain-containing protein [Bacteroidia bacterium]|nr:SRPBCC domain-containing protein [Bacteroidia bacterium]
MGKKDEINLRYIIYGSPLDVFKALTDEEEIRKWSKAQGKLSQESGGVFEWFDGWVKGEVLEVKAPSLLIFTWKPSEWDKNTSFSQVKLEINRHQAGSLVVVNHTGFPNETELEKHEAGWIDYVFEPLNEYFTT